MNSRTDEHMRAVLRAMESIAPEPPPLPAALPLQSPHQRPLLVATGVFAAVLLTIGLGTLALRSDRGGSAAMPVTTAGDSTPVSSLPRYTIDLPGWIVADIVDGPSVGTAIFTEQRDGGEWDGGNGAIVSVWSDRPDDSTVTTVPPAGGESAPPSGYEAALAALADAEHLGTVEVATGARAEVFRLAGVDPDYEFLWQYSDTITVQVVVLGQGYEAAATVVAAVTPITEEAWDDLVARFPSRDVATTTMPPNATAGPAPEHEEPTTTTIP